MMMRFLCIACLFVTFQSFGNMNISPIDTTVSLVNKAKVKKWMADGRHMMFDRDWRGALGRFKEVLAIDSKNAKAHYRAAECQYELMTYKLALDNLKKAEKLHGIDVDKEFFYTKGKVLQRLGKLSEAVEQFENFKKITKGIERKEDQYLTQKMIDDCKYAIKSVQLPTTTTVKTLGAGVNTRYREYGAVVSPDGKELYFTSRRQDTYGGNLASDKVYYSDIYMSKWDAEKEVWADAENLEGKGNTEEFDAVTDIVLREDGTLMLYVTYNASWTKSSDIGYTKRSDKGTWSKPKLEKKRTKKGGINTSFFESSASVTADGNTMYFVGEGFKGFGQGDIYMATKEGKKWSSPQLLDSTINTEFDENTVTISPDGQYLFFSSDGRLGHGGFDIYMCKKTENGWGKPENLPYPINSIYDDTHFKLMPDGKRALLTSAREDRNGLHDIYIVKMEQALIK